MTAAPCIIPLPAVAQLLGLTPDALRRRRRVLEADHGFPPPLNWSARPLRWRVDQVRAWLDRQGTTPPSPPPAPSAPILSTRR